MSQLVACTAVYLFIFASLQSRLSDFLLPPPAWEKKRTLFQTHALNASATVDRSLVSTVDVLIKTCNHVIN